MSTTVITIRSRQDDRRENDVYYEIWQPKSGILYHCYQRDGKIVKVAPFETAQLPTVINPKLILRWDDTELTFEDDHELQWYNVRLMIRTYYVDDDGVIQHFSDFGIFGSDVNEVTRKSHHLAEVRFLQNQAVKYGMEIFDHEIFTFHVNQALGTGNPEKYWENKVNTIWEGYIKKETTVWMDRNVVVPLSVIMNGLPIPPNIQTDKHLHRGLTAQSYWRIRSNPRAANEQWFLDRILECVRVRGSSLFDFQNTLVRFFTNQPYEYKDLHNCLADVVRICTMHPATYPYVPDKRKDPISGNKVDADDFNVIFFSRGDCEDGCGAAYLLYLTILFEEWDDSLMKWVRLAAAFLGIPVGISGRGGSPEKPSERSVAHMYAAIVPLPMFHYVMTGQTLDLLEFKTKFGFPSLEPLELFWKTHDYHCAIMETTIISTPFYEPRERVSTDKKKLYGKIRTILTKFKDRPVLWKNYTLKYPFAYDYEHGSIVHKDVGRITTDAVSLFYESSVFTLTDGTVVDLHLTKSFVPHGQKYGISGLELFTKTKLKDIPWRFVITNKITHEVNEAEKEIIRNFERPIITMRGGIAKELRIISYDPVKLGDEKLTLNTYRDEIPETWKSGEVPVDSNLRVMVYAWKLFPESTKKVMDVIKEETQKTFPDKEIFVRILPFGNGFMFIFYPKT